MTRAALIWIVATLTATTLMAFPASAAAIADRPPYDGCTAVPKIQYDSAKRQYLLENRFGRYVRTGSIFRRRYWYCH
jgi:hypothetical protein